MPSPLGLTALTYLDWAKRLDPDGNTSAIVEMLNTLNPVSEDAAVVEGNLPTGHRTTVRTGIPHGTWRLLNYGVQPTKSTTAQITDPCGMLETYSQIDKDLADLNGNTAAFRLSEDKPFLEGLTQDFMNTFFYGNESTTPAQFTGMAPRYNSVTAGNGKMLVDGGGTTNLTSLWIIVWSDTTIHLTFPKGKTAGLKSEDKGQVTLLDTQTPPGMYEGYRTHYKWDVGLVVRDWRYAARVCNLDSVACATGTLPDLVQKVSLAIRKIQNLKGGVPIIYCNRQVATGLDRKVLGVAGSQITTREVKEATPIAETFLGIPVHIADALLNNETQITGTFLP